MWIHDKLGSTMAMDGLAQLNREVLTLEYEQYADDNEGSYTCLDEEEDVTLDYNDTYVGAEVLLLIEGMMHTRCMI